MAVNIFHTRDGKLDANQQAALAALIARLANRQSKVLIHLHGGLVNEALGLGAAQRLSGPAPAGFGLGPEWEQIYVVWRTGVLETISANWRDLFENDRLYKLVLKKLIGFVSSKLGVPGVEGRSAFAAVNLTPVEIRARLDARPPHDPFDDVDIAIERKQPGGRGPTLAPQSDVSIADEFAFSLQLDDEFTDAADDIAAALTFEPATGRSLSPRGNPARGKVAFEHLDGNIKGELIATVPPDKAGRALFTAAQVGVFLIKHASAVVVRIIRRFRSKRDHGFYPTVVEELVREMYGDLIGAAIWGMMKKDAGDHFASGGLGEALVTALAANPPRQFAISAHSAGAIWASALVKRMAATPNAPKAKLAFLAPAVRMDVFADAIKQGVGVISGFRMFTMRDELEQNDAVLGAGTGFIYPRSLLYVVSGLFEDENADAFPDAPILGMQRFLNADAAWLSTPQQIDAVHRTLGFLAVPDHGIVYGTVAGAPGHSSGATAHGAFDDDPATLASVVTFIA